MKRAILNLNISNKPLNRCIMNIAIKSLRNISVRNNYKGVMAISIQISHVEVKSVIKKAR